MKAVLGIDAAWTEAEPSGVALVEDTGARWSVVCVAPSYEAFADCARGVSIDWATPRFPGTPPDPAALIAAAREMTSAELAVVAVDMPVAIAPFASRREADQAISRAFGAMGCGTHSPSPARPGAVGRGLSEALCTFGFPLATASAYERLPCTLEVYPHPALLALLGREYRVPYKASKTRRYWPNASTSERWANLLAELGAIRNGLRGVFGAVPIELPDPDRPGSLARLKRYEDALDALVCAWVGVSFLTGRAVPYGDDAAAIWVPRTP